MTDSYAQTFKISLAAGHTPLLDAKIQFTLVF